MKVEQEIPSTRIADLLSCAFEGGTGYWCRIVGYRAPTDPRSVWGKEKIYPPADYPLAGGAVLCEVTDEGDDPERAPLVLNMAAIKRGLARMANMQPSRHWAAFMAGDEDAETGDVFLQLCLLGEIVYG
jgi:hypothetical protein